MALPATGKASTKSYPSLEARGPVRISSKTFVVHEECFQIGSAVLSSRRDLFEAQLGPLLRKFSCS